MTTNGKKSQRLDSAKVDFLIARYSSLRDELQQRTRNNYQMMSLYLTISAAILSFGLQSASAAPVVFIVPILGTLMGIVIIYNELANRQIRMIIKNDIEAEFDFVSKSPAPQNRPIGQLGAGGIFLTVQILAFVLGLLKIQQYSTLDIVLIVSDILAMLIAIVLLPVVLRTIKNEGSPTQKAG